MSWLVKGCFLSKLSHHFLAQTPPPIARGANNRRTVFENVIEGLQKLADRLVFGKVLTRLAPRPARSE